MPRPFRCRRSPSSRFSSLTTCVRSPSIASRNYTSPPTSRWKCSLYNPLYRPGNDVTRPWTVAALRVSMPSRRFYCYKSSNPPASPETNKECGDTPTNLRAVLESILRYCYRSAWHTQIGSDVARRLRVDSASRHIRRVLIIATAAMAMT